MSSSQRFLLIGGAIVVLALLGGILYWFSGRSSAPENNTSTPSAYQENSNPMAQPSGNQNEPTPPPAEAVAAHSGYLVTLATSMGTIQFQTYDSDAPKAVQNFVTLAQKGFYDNLTFHRVIKDFMIQGGDPKGDGTGGPGYAFADELNPNTPSGKAGYLKGVVAMANSGPNTNGSQFFIMLQDMPFSQLPYNYTIFGKVIKGIDVVDAIGSVSTGANDRPLKAVVIKSAKVETISQ